MNPPDSPSIAGANAPKPDQLTRWMIWWYGRLQRQRIGLTVVLLVLGVLLFTASRNIVWQTSLLSFFSAHSAAIHDVRLSEDRNGLADAMRLDVHFAAGKKGNLSVAVRLLAQALQNTHAFSSLWYGTPASRQVQAQVALQNSAPILLSHQQFNTLRRRLSARWLDHYFHRQVQKMAGPAGQIVAAQLQADPLDMRQLLVSQFKSVHAGAGAHFSGPLLVSANGRHAMMILVPPFRPENVAASEKMLTAIRSAIASVEKHMPALRVWIVGPYRNFVENQRLVKHDLKMISIVGSLLVAGVIAWYFRRMGSVVLCMIPPIVGLGAAMGIAGLFHLHIPLIVLGFDGLLCGSTTDYGIQLIAALQRRVKQAGQYQTDMPALSARDLVGPISMSVCTSMTGYGALAESSATGLQTLGLFIASATGCIWLVTFIVLPAYLGPWVCRTADYADSADKRIRGDCLPTKARNASLNDEIAPESEGADVAANGPNNRATPSGNPHDPRNPRSLSRSLNQWFHPGLLKLIATSAFILMTLWLGSRAIAVDYTANGQSLDGSSVALKHDEAKFSAVWGHLRQSGVITIHQVSADRALAQLHTLDHLLKVLQAKRLIAGYTTASAILPDTQTAQRRLAAWRAFFTPEQMVHAQALLAEAAIANGLRAGAFDSALKSWQSPLGTASALQRLQESPATLFPGVVAIGPHDISISSTVQLNAVLPPALATRWAADVRHDVPGVSVICGLVLYLNASHHARMEAKRLFPWVILLILIPLWIYFRRLDIAAIAALSLAIGFIWLLGVAQWWGGGLNLLCLVPILFTMGVAVDYGIYASSDPSLGPGGAMIQNRNSATFLCAATTILGTAAMILAGHPVLHWIGITLTAGILGGYLASYFVVGPLVRIVLNPPTAPTKRRIYLMVLNVWRTIVLLAMAILLVGLLGGCCSVPPPQAYRPPLAPPPTTAAARHALAKFPRQWDRQFFAALNWHGHRVSMIGRIKGKSPGTLRVTCASEFGTLLCDVRVTGNASQVLHTSAAFPKALARHIAMDVASALRLPAAAALPLKNFHRRKHLLSGTRDHTRYLFAGPAGTLRVCRIRNSHENIEIQYRHYHDRHVPHEILIWDAGHCLLLTINFDAQ